jgi:hypothetical protein
VSPLLLPLLLAAPAEAGRYDDWDGEVLLIVMNPRELARREAGGMMAGLGDFFGVTAGAVSDAVAVQLEESLDEQSIEARVERERASVGPSTWWALDDRGRGWREVMLPEGTWELISLSISDPEAVIRDQKGGFTLAVARTLGMNLPGRVNEAVLMETLAVFEEEGVEVVFWIRDAEADEPLPGF